MSLVLRRALKSSGWLLVLGLSATLLAAVVDNLAPVIDSTPYPVAEVGQTYRYAVHATDPDDNDVGYSLEQGPDGMAYSVDDQAVNWTPAADQTGLSQVTVRARDSWGASVDQSYALRTVADYCEIYPITLPQQLLADAATGAQLDQIARGTGPGNFSWLTWSGATNAPTLADSLLPPGDSYNYVSPDSATDHLLEVDDWAQGAPGSMNADAVRTNLDALKARDIIIPTWSTIRGQGSSFDYRVARFAVVRLKDYQLTGQGWLSFEFRGFKDCYNDAPVAANQTLTTPEDQPLPVLLSATDPENDALTYQVVQGPAHGRLEGTAPALTYVPDANYNGPDAFTFRANDAEFASNIATVSITVTPVNDPPVAANLELTTAEDTALPVNLSGSDLEGDPLVYTVVDAPSHGQLGGTGATPIYTPALNYSGDDHFSYRVNDGEFDSNVATVLIHVTPVNDPPVAADQRLTTDEDVPLAIVLTGADVDGDAIGFALRQRPAHGELVGDGAHWEYRPARDFFGEDSFTFISNDGQLDSLEATVHITVVERNAPPTADDLHFEVRAGTPVEIILTGADPDGDALSFRPVSTPDNGVLSGLQPNLSYLAEATFSGTVSFQYIANDGRLDSAPATVTIVVTAANHAPTIVSTPSNFFDERTNYGYDLDALDPDVGDVLTYSADREPIGLDIASDSGVMAAPSGDMLVGGVREKNLACRTPAPRSTFDPVLKWGRGEDPTEEVRRVLGPALVAQLTDDNGDGKIDTSDKPDVVVGSNTTSTSGNLIAMRGDTGETIFNKAITYLHTLGTGAIGDVDGDGLVDIAVLEGSGASHVSLLSNTGTLKWRATVPGHVVGDGWSRDSLAIGDLDGDGSPEIVRGATIINNDGTTRCTGAYDKGGDAGYAWSSIIADVDLDGKQEVIAGRSIYDSQCRLKKQLPGSADGYAAVGNFDADPEAEVVLQASNRTTGQLYVFNIDGSKLFGPVNHPGGGEGGPPTLANVDNDPYPEIGTAGRAKYAVFDNTGAVLWTQVTRDYSSRQTGSTFFDFEGDGFSEVIYGDEVSIFIWDGRTGALRYTFPNSSGTTLEYPVVADIDGDHSADIIAGFNAADSPGTGGGLRVISSASGSWSDARPLWTQHAFSITNVDDNGGIPAHPEPSWLAHNTYRLNQLSRGKSLGQPDLALFDLRLDTADQSTLRLTALNRGLANSQAGTIVRFYGGNSAAARVLGTVSLPPLAPDESINVTLTNVDAHSLGDDVFATVDEIDAVTECAEGNNTVQARVFHLRATDRGGLFDRQVVTASLLDVNEAPSFEITTPGTPHVGKGFTHQLKASDPDTGDGLIYSLISGPTGMTIEPVSGELRWTPTAPQAGARPVTVSVTDLRGLSQTQTLTFVVPANSLPMYVSTPITSAIATEEYRYDVDATDADGDLLSYSLLTKPAGMTIDAMTGVIRWVPTSTQGGTTTISVSVKDPYSAGVAQTFSLVVTLPVNHAPTFTTTPVTAIALGQRYQYDALASDEDGDVLNFMLSVAPLGMAVDTVTGMIIWQPRTDQVGAHSVVLQVSDARGGMDTQEFTVLVSAGVDGGNHPPSVSSVPETTALIDQAYSYAVTTSDLDGDTLSYALQTAPSGMTIDANSGAVSWMPTATQSGLNAVVVLVSDGRGGTATQSFSILASTVDTGGTGNRPPSITSDPLTLVTLGQTYRYYLTAVDADGDTLSFQLMQAPSGMTIDPTTGVLAWTPSALGPVSVSVRVDDGRGGASIQSFTVTTVDSDTEIDHRPVVLEAPFGEAKVGLPYNLTLQAVDADGDAMTFTLVSGPAGATVDPVTGQVAWTPDAVGSASFTVRISSGDGYTDVTWTVQVVAAETPLSVHVVVTPERVAPGAAITVAVEFAGASGPVNLQASLNNNPVALDANGATSLVAPTTPGFYQLVVTVDDGNAVATDTADFFIADPSDTTAPTVAISAPAIDGRVTAPTAVVGQVLGDDVARWTLSLIDKSTGAMTAIAQGSQASGPGVLGQLDPTLLSNGFYTLVLQAWDAGGNQAQDSRSVLVDGDMKLGHYSVSFEDVAIPMAGFPLRVTRTYDTRRRNERLDFGYGWSVDYQNLRLTESRAPGYSWSLLSERNGFFGNWCVRPNGDPIVAITGPDGELMKFRAKASPECQFLVPQTDVQLVFEPLPGTDAQLDQTDYLNLRLASVAGSGVYNLLDLSDPYQAAANPSHYRLKLPDGTVYSVTQGTGISKIVDPDGNTLSFTRDGVKHSLGQEVRFFRDGQGRIEEVVLPDGARRQYTYTPGGDLEMAVDTGGDLVSFGYLARAPHYLQDIVDPRGVRVSRNEYDDDGRLVATIDADGHRIEYTHNLAGRTEIIRDRRGNASIFAYDDEGRVTGESNTLGETTLHSYDANGNELSTTDPLGHTTVRTFDPRGNALTETNAFGQRTTNTYNERNNLRTQIDALGRVVATNSYHGYNGKLVMTQNARGELTTFGYDSGLGTNQTGELTGMVDAANQRTIFQVNQFGHRSREWDALGQLTVHGVDLQGRERYQRRTRTRADGTSEDLVTSYTLDAKDRIVATVHPDGSRTTVDYDGNDKPIKTCDALNRCTRQQYDARGQLERTTYPDGTFETTAYDENGNVVAQTDRGGRTTKMVYDAANRLVTTLLPDATPGDDSDNPRTGSEYDAAGRLKASINERGVRTEYGYDAAGRRTTVTDALGHVTTTAYDAAGQRVAVTDALGRMTRFVYDLAGRLTQTIHPDDTAFEDDNPRTTIEYDAVGRKVAETDELGRQKAYAYDAVGRMVKVTLPNPANGLLDDGSLVTRFVYDEVGNKTQQIDALGRVTRWEYDAMGRQTRRTLPGGQTETSSYDAAGQLRAHTDFNGRSTRYSYDEVGRLVGVDYETDADVITTYTASGQRESVTDGQGTTVYSYDARDRLIRVAQPDGQVLTYGYDAAGNRTALHSAALDQSFDYDPLNRLSKVHSQTLGGATRTVAYSYDAVGNRQTLTQANGATTTTRFDERNRLRELLTRSAAGVLLFGATYDVDATGARSGIGEFNAQGPTRSVGYAYDGTKRLLAEVIERPGQPARVSSYVYDAVGNRLSKTEVGTLTTYTVDANDRLTTETTGGVSTLYTYDANGNSTGQAKPGEVVTYGYDEANRRVRTTTASGVTTTGYSADGLRNRETGNGHSTLWLIDPNRDYAQTLEAYRDQQLSTVWLYGDELLAQSNVIGGGLHERNLHSDGMGSVRQASDVAGNLTDSFEYDAFGIELNRTGSTDIDHRYRAEQVDPNTGFYNLRARWYDPSSGRFTSMDSFAGSNGDPISLHKYLYANADPINNWDPSGYVTLSDQMQGLQIRTMQRVNDLRSSWQAGNLTRGRFHNLLGDVIEEAVFQAIEMALADIPGVDIGRQVPLHPDSKSSLDFLVAVEGKVVHVEAKFQLPTRSGKGFSRLAAQLRNAIASGKLSSSNRGIVVAFKELGSRARTGRYQRLLKEIDADSGMVGNAQGFLELAMELRSVFSPAAIL